VGAHVATRTLIVFPLQIVSLVHRKLLLVQCEAHEAGYVLLFLPGLDVEADVN